jgi:hypothetical protein
MSDLQDERTIDDGERAGSLETGGDCSRAAARMRLLSESTRSSP